jgi:hypothetical protein
MDAIMFGERQEDPASLLAPFEDCGVGEDLEMPGNAWLTLSKDLRQLSDGQLHQPQQHDDTQPGRIGERLESVG